MGSFWHFDAGNLSILVGLLVIYGKLNIMGFQHKLMWHDYQKRHGMNGQKAAAGKD